MRQAQRCCREQSWCQGQRWCQGRRCCQELSWYQGAQVVLHSKRLISLAGSGETQGANTICTRCSAHHITRMARAQPTWGAGRCGAIAARAGLSTGRSCGTAGAAGGNSRGSGLSSGCGVSAGGSGGGCCAGNAARLGAAGGGGGSLRGLQHKWALSRRHAE